MQKELAIYVLDYARQNYNKSGWSVVVECYSLEDIERVITENGAITEKEALDSFEIIVDIWGERLADASYYKSQRY